MLDAPVEGSSDDAVTLPIDGPRLVRTIFIVCVVAELLFVLLDYHVNRGGMTEIGALRRMFNTAREDGLASWFGTTQTLLAGLTLWVLYGVSRAQAHAVWRQRGWLLLAVFFTYMAVDDGAQLHERFGTVFSVMQEDGGSSVLDVFPSYAWQVLFLPMFGIVGVTMLVFLWFELPLRHQRLLVVAALGCLVVAVGLDFVEGLEADHPWNLYTILADNAALEAWSLERFGDPAFETLDHFSRSFEEFLEMLANTFFWVVFLRQLTIVAGEVRVRFSRAT